MRKKCAILLLLLISCVSVLTGCNLFSTNNYVALSSIVATSGSISVTREQLLNAYYSSGYYYNYVYGYTQEEAIRMTIDDIIDQEYLLQYIEKHNDKYALTSEDYNIVVSNTYSYLDSRVQTIVDEIRSEYGLDVSDVTTEEEEETPEYAPQEKYATKFDYFDGKVIYENYSSEEEDYEYYRDFANEEEAKNYALKKYTVQKVVRGEDEFYKALVWDRFMTTLKEEQSGYGYDKLDNASVLEREISKVFDSNLDAQKISRYQNIVERENGFYFDSGVEGYVMTEEILQKIVDEYKRMYSSNMDMYKSMKNKNSYYVNVADTESRKNYVYYGKQDEETLITCTHILIQLSEDQLSEISALESNPLYYGEKLERAKNAVSSWANTFAYERDLKTGFELGNAGKSVEDLYNEVVSSVRRQETLEDKVNKFNEYLYAYNVDSGIINAHYDYVVGTKNSAMVDSFTDLVRGLYDDGNGTPGSIGICYEENDNYSGYHIVMYTGTLNNLFSSSSELDTLNTSNVYNILSSEKTSLSYNQTIFELVFDNTIQDIYESISANAVKTEKSGQTITYNVGNFSDLY